MQELRLVAVSEDGTYAVLAVPGRGGRFVLPIDDRLRTVARGQFSRLAQYEIEVENPLRPKEIQDRIRAGETAEEIADAAGIPIDRVRRFEGPVLAEREYRAQEAQRSTVRGHTESGPGPRLGEVVAERLTEAGAPADTLAWDSRKRADGNWQVQLQFTVDHRPQLAEWVFDPRRRHVIPADDLARRLCLPQADWPAGRLGALGAPTATVTPIGSRLGGHHADSRSDPRAESRAESDRALARGAHAAPAAAPTHAPWSREAREPGWAREAPPPAVPAARTPEADRSTAPTADASPEYASTDYFSTDYISEPAPARAGGGGSPAEPGEPPRSAELRAAERRVAELRAAETGRAAEAGRAAGRTAEAGRAAEAGRTAEAGRAAEAGRPAEAGRTAEAGRAAEAGRPAETARPASPAASTSPPAASAADAAAAAKPGGRHASMPPASTSPASAERAAAPAAGDASAGPAPGVAPAAAQRSAESPRTAGAAGTSTAGTSTASEAAGPAEPADAPAAPARPGRKAGRNRRASVPSWDEIMLGNSRQPD